MQPTRIYVKSVLKAMATGQVTGAVHITGGGFQENLPRSFGDHLTAHIDLDTWTRPAIFKWLETQGDVGAEEMLRTFNCGIGFVMFCAPQHVERRYRGTCLNRRRAARLLASSPHARLIQSFFLERSRNAGRLPNLRRWQQSCRLSLTGK